MLTKPKKSTPIKTPLRTPIKKKKSNNILVKKSSIKTQKAEISLPSIKMSNTIDFYRLRINPPYNIISKKTVIKVSNLRPKETYVIQINVEVDNAAKVEIDFKKSGASVKSFILDVESKTVKGGRFKISPERQEGDGTATIEIIAPDNFGIIRITAEALEVAGETPYALAQKGLCPICKEKGYWQTMALKCAKHGIILG